MTFSWKKKILRTSGMASFLVVAPIVFFSCGGENSVREEPVKTERVFQDPKKLFQVTVPEGFVSTSVAVEGADVYQFQKTDDQGNVLRVVRFRVEPPPADGKTPDLFTPGYESAFLEDCQCSILERGVVNFNGRPSRQFIVTREGGSLIGFHRHLVLRNRVVRIVVEGRSAERDTLRARFQEILNSFVPIAREEGSSP